MTFDPELDEPTDDEPYRGAPRYPDPRDAVERCSIQALRDATGAICPSCGAQAVELLEATTFEFVCADCGARATKYALVHAALEDAEALRKILSNYDGMWAHLAEEGRVL